MLGPLEVQQATNKLEMIDQVWQSQGPSHEEANGQQ